MANYPLSIGTASPYSPAFGTSFQLPFSTSASGAQGSSFSLGNMLPYIGAGIDLIGSLSSGLSTGSYNVNDDGSISYDSNGWEEFFHRDKVNQGKLNALQWNTALKQYNEQYQLQKDAFDYNKELSNRQQDLAEDSYYNGILRQASQLQSLGINPATVGSSLSGMSMSGGSSVNSGSASAGNMPSMQSGGDGSQGLDLNALSVLAGIKAKQDELKIQQYNAETSRITADAGASNALASAENTRAITAFLEEHGVTPSPYSGSKEGVIMGNVFNIGSAITSAVIGYLFGKNNKNNKNGGGKPSSGSKIETVVPDKVTSPSMVPNHKALPSPDYELMEGPISSGRVSGADVITALNALSSARKGTKEAGFWTNLVKALDGANSLEVNMGVTMALQAMRGLLFGF